MLRAKMRDLKSMTCTAFRSEEEEEEGDLHPWAITPHTRETPALPPQSTVEEEICAQIAEVVAAIAPPAVVTVLVLPDNCSDDRRLRDQALACRILRQSIPNMRFEIVPAMPPVPDGRGGDLWFDSFYPPEGNAAEKSVRRDLNTGVASTLRQMTVLTRKS